VYDRAPMAEDPTEKTPRGPLRALSDWLKRAAPPSHAPDAVATPPPEPAVARTSEDLPSRIGHYAITGKLGQGGMGIVYSARDERLQRTVALKTMSSVGGDEDSRKRFWREARAAASVNHPNVCQLYEIGEDRGELFIAMELLEGEPLGERLRRGPMSVSETLPIGLGILAALAALHARGVIHRDLKPSNVFLTPHGVKLLDFGLARSIESDATRSLASIGELTRTGVIVGTPRYMAPEQVTGEPIDGRSDLFAAGAILFEMLAGRPAFAGRNVVEILHATMNEQPPALTGSSAVAAVDRVIRRAMAKRASDRPASADAMASELRAVSVTFGEDAPTVARALTRLVVLPFRILRSDPETDFLAFSLPDAIATSLSRFGSLIVRSSATAARFGGDAPDLKALAVDADVDRVVMGTLLRSGDQIQASAQLVEAPSGTLLTSHAVLSSLGDLFRLQDDIARRVVAAIALSLAGDASAGMVDGRVRGGDLPSAALGSVSPTPRGPHDARAYALYLEANALARSYDQLPRARELYERSVELDPGFAPAWAQLGRCLRVIGKYIDESGDSTARAEVALRRALEIDPRLSVAHKHYANLEADTGQARSALVRLLGEAHRHGNDPELFAGLVHACRYCGLFEESMAAHEEARRLDPHIHTSLEQTVLMTGDIDRLLSVERLGAIGGDEVIRVVGLGLAGRRDEARGALLAMREATLIRAFRPWRDFLLAWLDRRVEDMRNSRAAVGSLRIMEDPEAIFQEGWMYCDVGELEHGLDLVRRAVARGYAVAPTLTKAPAFEALRGWSEFAAVIADAEAGRAAAAAAFREGGGGQLVGR
jgi:eukaryotic-like serine/threonine-protein kinase